jgi:lysozyme family protein
MNFDQAFHQLLGHEGGFVDHPADPGGATCWGVTERVARAYGYTGPMRSLPIDVAKAIYKRDYWDAVRADEVPTAVRYSLFDGAVNSGVRQSIKWLQRALGVADDGALGPQTLAAVKAADGTELKTKMLGARLQFMTDLPTWPAFGKGWARRIASLLRMP